jgi:hypothetical protein
MVGGGGTIESARLCGMLIGDKVIWCGRVYVLKGLDPMSVPGRLAELEDVDTGERVRVPVDELIPSVVWSAVSGRFPQQL